VLPAPVPPVPPVPSVVQLVIFPLSSLTGCGWSTKAFAPTALCGVA
jgi:hypothetical protein